jgi:hypothetical protein
LNINNFSQTLYTLLYELLFRGELMAPVSWGLRTLQLRYKGVLDLNGLQRIMIQWLKARRYMFQENTHKHKPGNEFGKQEEIFWTAWRNVDSYVRYGIEIYWHIWDLEEVEVVENGKKKILSKGRFEIWFNGSVTFDYQMHWEKTKWQKHLRNFYHKYVLRPEGILASLYWDELYYRIYKLRDLMKDYMNLKTKGYEFRRYVGDNIP